MRKVHKILNQNLHQGKNLTENLLKKKTKELAICFKLLKLAVKDMKKIHQEVVKSLKHKKEVQKLKGKKNKKENYPKPKK